MDVEAVQAYRLDTIATLRRLLPYVEGDRRQQNEAFFDELLAEDPPLSDDKWGRAAFITGVYARWIGHRPLNEEEREAFWDAIVWAVSYEEAVRPRMSGDRLRDLVRFLSAVASDEGFIEMALKDLIDLAPQLRPASAEILRVQLAPLDPGAKAPDLQGLLEERAAAAATSIMPKPEDVPGPLGIIIRFWRLLDRKHEHKNRDNLDLALAEPSSAQAVRVISQLGGITLRNIVYRMAVRDEQFTEDELHLAVQLADSVIESTSPDHQKHAREAARNKLLMNVVTRLRLGTAHPESVADEIEAFESSIDAEGRETLDTWNAFTQLLTHALRQRRLAGSPDSLAAQGWLSLVAKSRSRISRRAQDALANEVRQHGVEASFALRQIEVEESLTPTVDRGPEAPLGFLGDDFRQELERSIRDEDIDKTVGILVERRGPLLAALSRALGSSAFREYQQPRGRYRIARSRQETDPFPRALSNLESDRPEDARKALSIFEESRRLAQHPDYANLAREWALYARARVEGAFGVAAEWQAARESQQASWEELWNLAVFYLRQGSPADALDVLRPGVNSLKAPMSHLSFALYCATQLYEQLEPAPENSDFRAIADFLLANLARMPLAHCYLAWLLVAAEVKERGDLITQARILSTYQRISLEPLEVPAPTSRLDESQAEGLRQRLQTLNLEETWRLWVNDFAHRNPGFYRGWQWVSEADERAGQLDDAEYALRRPVDLQVKEVQRRKRRGEAPQLRFLRANLTRLFEFYRRNALNSRAEVAFQIYYQQMPEVWDAGDAGNFHLINLTRVHLDKVRQRHEAQTKQETPTTRQESIDVWMALASDLSEVHELRQLVRLRDRVGAALTLLPQAGVIQDKVKAVQRMTERLAQLDSETWGATQLVSEIADLNDEIENAVTLVESEPVLRPLTPLVAAARRSLHALSRQHAAFPVLEFGAEPLGAGLARDADETALVLGLTNPGPGRLRDIEISCEGDHVSPRGAASIAALAPGTDEVVALPIYFAKELPATRPTEDCRVTARYAWGLVGDLTAEAAIRAPVFSFVEYLHAHGIAGYEFPVPYVFGAIDTTKHDPRLFQGRSEHLRFVRENLAGARTTGTPLYFHGVRKVGKTSLLLRVASDLRASGLLAAVVDLTFIRADSQPLEQVVNSLTRRILIDAAAAGLECGVMEPVGASSQNPVADLEPFFEELGGRNSGSKIVLLMDEFYTIVDTSTTAMLDLFRRLHQQDVVRFIFSSWLRPKPLQAACPDTQLFPLVDRAVDFLRYDEVAAVLREPVSDYGIDIPEATVRALVAQSAGNPYWVQKLAFHGVNHLSTERRTVLTPQDVDELAQDLASDPANFDPSVLSPFVVHPEERRAAIALAKNLDPDAGTMPVDHAISLLGEAMVQTLEDKHIVQLKGDSLAIRGRMLATYLRERPLKQERWRAAVKGEATVGIFVDIENVLDGSLDVSIQRLGRCLLEYAAKFGRVLCAWVAANPKNLRDPFEVKLTLEEMGFQVRFPRSEVLNPSLPTKDVADFVLVECITDEMDHSRPDTFIIVTGDRAFFEKINALLDHHFVVRVAARGATLSDRQTSMSTAYKDFFVRRDRERRAAGFTDTDFFLDDVDDLVRACRS